MAQPDVATDEPREEALELRKEAFTMALYVAICLLAALSVVAEHGEGAQADTFKIVWGTTLGLALAHWFAFRVSSRLVASGSVRRFPDSAELDVVRLVLAALIALVGYAVARGAGASPARSMVYAVSILVIASAVALIKNVLAGH
jgi:hypothetical protein